MQLKFKVQIGTEMHLHIAIYKATEEMKVHKFDQVKIAKLKTAISELGQNILKYADKGTVAVYEIVEPRKGLCVEVSDRGPGIADLEEALLDNYSSSGTLGLGLPGVRRMMDKFEIKSEVGVGTKVTISLYT